MTTGSQADERDAVGVETILPGVPPEEADGCLDIVDVRRKPIVSRQAIVDSGHRVPVGGDRDDFAGDVEPLAGHPRPAVDEDDDGTGCLAGPRQEQVEREHRLLDPGIGHIEFERCPVGGVVLPEVSRLPGGARHGEDRRRQEKALGGQPASTDPSAGFRRIGSHDSLLRTGSSHGGATAARGNPGGRVGRLRTAEFRPLRYSSRPRCRPPLPRANRQGAPA